MSTAPSYIRFFQSIGAQCIAALRETGKAAEIGWGGIRKIVPHAFVRRNFREIVLQMYAGGIKSLGVVTIVAIFIGMIMALQIGIELRVYNQEAYIAPAVMATMLREMAPFMAGLILAACVGSSMAAQLGTMTINEEISALELMSIDPVRFLVMPRMVSMMILLPLLSFYTAMMGVIGGAVVGYVQFTVPFLSYYQLAMDFADSRALFVGLFKALLFGILITTIACYEGFSSQKGAVGVGMATRACVIKSFLFILIVGYFVTRLFY
ncbi:MAG: ABC transporter permease [Kiritimatiellaeota bacterium]|nr:ABC transporter permease [Kiritimatiellota bacterium]